MRLLARLVSLVFAVAMFAVAPAAGATDLDDGLIAHWTFEEGSGGTATDVTSHTNDGAITGAAYTLDTPQPYAGSYSLDFDGSDVVTVPDSADVDLGDTEAFTLSLWLKPSAVGAVHHILGKRPGCAGMNYQLARDGGSLVHYSSSNGGTRPFGVDLVAGTWTLYTVTFDGATITTYATDTSGTTTSASAPFTSGPENDDPLTLGQSDGCGSGFVGLMDDVRLYDRSLSAGEVQLLATCGLLGTDADDEIVGTAAADVICGMGGADVLRGAGGPDTLLGGNGADRLYGGLGMDSLDGGAGADHLFGKGHADEIYGGTGLDQLNGGAGNDVLLDDDGAGGDVLDGKFGSADECDGDPGDTLVSCEV